MKLALHPGILVTGAIIICTCLVIVAHATLAYDVARSSSDVVGIEETIRSLTSFAVWWGFCLMMSFSMLTTPVGLLRILPLVLTLLFGLAAGTRRARIAVFVGFAALVAYASDILSLFLSRTPMLYDTSIASITGGEAVVTQTRYTGGWPWHGLDFQPSITGGLPSEQLMVILANLGFWIVVAGVLTVGLRFLWIRKASAPEDHWIWVFPVAGALFLNQLMLGAFWFWFYD